LPHISLERALQVLVGEDRKSKSRDCFFVLASSSLHRFDHALRMMSFPYSIFLIKIKIKKLGSFVAVQFFQRFVSHLMYPFWFISSLCFNELFLHVVKIISLTYAKFSCSFFMIDSCFSHVMTMWTIPDSPKVYIFLSNLLLLDSPNMREVFDKMVKLTRC
jgi:hypothetical protein